MIANYHTHTWRCSHADGMEGDYVKAALEAGLEILGFADHSPYEFPPHHKSSFRMTTNQLRDYCDVVLELRQRYQGKIQIPLGLEMEYYPALFGNMLEIFKDYPLDYLILGQHFVGNEHDAPYNGVGSEDVGLLKQYVRQSCDAMNTGKFTYFAHPDLIHFLGSTQLYLHHMRDICREANSCGIPLEYNLLGQGGGRHYPTAKFWELAAEEGCAVILGVDAHQPEALLDKKNEERALRYLRSLGITPMETVALRPIR